MVKTRSDAIADAVRRARARARAANDVARRGDAMVYAFGAADPVAAPDGAPPTTGGLAMESGPGLQAIDDAAALGARIRTRRRDLGLTQQAFADLAGVGRRFVVELEAGKPTLELGRVLKACQAAGLRILVG